MTQKHQQRKPSHHINFKTLTDKELDQLSIKWEKEAKVFEKKLEGYLTNPNPNPEKAERLWGVGNSLWRRLYKLETFRNRKSKRQQTINQ